MDGNAVWNVQRSQQIYEAHDPRVVAILREVCGCVF